MMLFNFFTWMVENPTRADNAHEQMNGDMRDAFTPPHGRDKSGPYAPYHLLITIIGPLQNEQMNWASTMSLLRNEQRSLR